MQVQDYEIDMDYEGVDLLASALFPCRDGDEEDVEEQRRAMEDFKFRARERMPEIAKVCFQKVKRITKLKA